MIIDYWYSLNDLMLYSRQIYLQLIADYNHAVFPMQIIFLIVGIALFSPILPGNRHYRLSLYFLAICWLWLGIAFHYNLFSTINWLAKGYAVMFVIQGLSLVYFTFDRRPVYQHNHPNAIKYLGHGLIYAGLLGQPLLGLMFVEQLDQLQYFGITPNATVTVTLGVLLLGSARTRKSLIIPLVWGVAGGLSSMIISPIEGWVMLTMMMISIVLIILRKRHQKMTQVTLQ